MIYYTNIGTIAPDNSYLVFNAEGSILGQCQVRSFQISVEGMLFFWEVPRIVLRTFKVHVSMSRASLVIGLQFHHGPVRHAQEVESYHPLCSR